MSEPIIAHLLCNDRFSERELIIDLTESNLAAAMHKKATLSALYDFTIIPTKETYYA